jgi:hypothetical protein
MRPFDPTIAAFPIDPSRVDLAREFQDNVRGPHSGDLRRVLNRMRGGPMPGKYVLVVLSPGREWVLAQLPARRGDPIQVHEDVVFTSLDDAEWSVFRLRWRDITGEFPDV